MRLAFWPGLGGGTTSLAEIAPVLEARGIEPETLDRGYERRDFRELDPLARELAATGADVYAGRSWGGVLPPFDADELEAIVRGYEGYDAAATLDAPPDGLPVLLVAAPPQPDQAAPAEPLLQRFAELVPRGTTSHVDAPHDVVWGLGPALGDLVADRLEAEDLR